jgi:hypothetical protein
MAKFFKADESIVKLVDEIANEIGLAQFVDFETLDVVNLKEVVKIVKANEYAEYLSGREDLILVLVNGEAFDLLPDGPDENGVDNKYMWLRLAMEQIAYDSEKEKIVIGCPKIEVPVGMYEKFKGAAVDSALLAQYTLAQIAEKKEQEKAERAAQKKEKGRKKKF